MPVLEATVHAGTQRTTETGQQATKKVAGKLRYQRGGKSGYGVSL